MTRSQKIGLIAGSGRFPIVFAKTASARGVDVYAAAIKDSASPELAEHALKIEWIKFGLFGQIFSFFKKYGITEAVMAGALIKADIFSGIELDERSLAVMKRLTTLNDDSILRAVADEFQSEGITISPSTVFTPELKAEAGILTKRAPNEQEKIDIIFGWEMAKAIGTLDIGQCVVVRNKAVLAVEAIEGTDEAIKRAGKYGRENAVVVKVLKPNQDIRFDMPAVGPGTIETMRRSGASALAIEAQNTLIFDREEMIREADKHGISIIARTNE